MAEPVEQRMRILIADDDSLFRRGVARLFPADQFEVVEVENGELALDAVRQGKFDLVIADYKMPKVDGLEILGELKTLAPEVPVVIVSAYAGRETIEAAASLGAFAVLEKPFSVEQFTSRCQEALQLTRGTLRVKKKSAE